MLIDEARITIKAGNGGDGKVNFKSNRQTLKGGPDGGDGGDGGSIYFVAVNDISKLEQFRYTKKFKAEDGQNGKASNCTGKNGEDLVLEIPVGTIVNYDNGTFIEFTQIKQKELIARGGGGGRGNFALKSPTLTTPKIAEKGFITKEKELFLQLKLIAHVGLIGLPNAGKTSLLNELTNASAKVANYRFTTLEPNLGVLSSGHIIADIPGLIEGASLGKGLGVKFLKHIERTQILVHCLSAESNNFLADYQIIRNEISSYSSKLAEKKEIIVITKSDLLDEQKIKEIKKEIKPDFFISIIDDKSLKEFQDKLSIQCLSTFTSSSK